MQPCIEKLLYVFCSCVYCKCSSVLGSMTQIALVNCVLNFVCIDKQSMRATLQPVLFGVPFVIWSETVLSAPVDPCAAEFQSHAVGLFRFRSAAC